MKEFFIMLRSPDGENASPMTETENDEVVFFKTYEQALKEAKNHRYAQAFGFAIFNINSPYGDD